MGRKGGALSHVRPDELAGLVLAELIARNGLDPLMVDDVIMGCVTQIGEQGYNVGRMACLAAGLPVEVPGLSLNRMCGSGQQAVNFACMAVMSGQADIVIGAGVESMSRVAMGSDGGDLSPKVTDRFLIIPQGLSAELVAERWNLGREELDAFSYESHRRAIRAIDAGLFQEEIVPVPVTLPDGSEVVVSEDETPRRDTSPEKMASLEPCFKDGGVVTAGNSSQISDGAAAVLVMSRERARELGLRPRARFVASALSGVDPTIMLTGPIPATRKILDKAGLALEDMDVIEVNEAFASVVLAWGRELEPDWSRVNPNGGSIALGHPLGTTGARLIGSTVRELERRGGRYALITMCIGFGMGIATILERVEA